MTASPETAINRIRNVMIAFTAVGAIALFVWRGWSWSAGWLLGCAASGLNYHWLRRVTESVGARPAKDHQAILLGVRYLLLGGGAYVILKYTAISLPATLAGLLVPAAAVIVEILIELVYARN
jgi:hypothetical protein